MDRYISFNYRKEFARAGEKMNEDRRVQLQVWDNIEEEDEALESDYQSLMEWWKEHPIPKLLLVHEMLEMVTKAKFWVWYLNDQSHDQDKRILDMKCFLQNDIFYKDEEDI
jgi:hypothetical protein